MTTATKIKNKTTAKKISIGIFQKRYKNVIGNKDKKIDWDKFKEKTFSDNNIKKKVENRIDNIIFEASIGSLGDKAEK